MTTQPAVSRFDQRSLIGIGASVAVAVAVGLLCTWAGGVPSTVTGTLTAGAGGLPAAVAYSLRAGRRNVTDEMSRIRHGELRRPIGLVVVMLAAALLLVYWTAAAFIPMPQLNLAEETILSGLIAATPCFFISSYASHYLGSHAYRWTVVAVSAAFIIPTAILFVPWQGSTSLRLLSMFVLHYLMVLIASLAGTWYGRRHHDRFLAKKLARLERKAAKEAAKKAAKRDESTLQSPATGLPHNLPTEDPFEKIEKLDHLRKIGALTEEEFQAKKSEILGRI